MQVRTRRPIALSFIVVLAVAASGNQIGDSSSQHPPVGDLATALGIPKPPGTSSVEYSKLVARGALDISGSAVTQLSTSSGLPVNMNASSALSAAVITNVAGQGVNLLGDWDGQEDLVADHSGRVANMLTPGVILTRAAISEHTIANGFPEDVFYYGDSVGNVYIASTAVSPSASLTQNPPTPNVLTLNLPTLANAFGTLSSDSQLVITGIAVNPVSDLSAFANVNGGFSFFSGKIGEILYVTFMDTGSGFRLASNQVVRSGLLAFPIADVVSPAASPPGIQSNTGYPVTVGGSFGVAFSVFSNLAGVAVDDDGSVYFQQADLIQFSGANIVKITNTGTNQDRSSATNGYLTSTTLNPVNGLYGTASGPASQVNTFTNYSGTSTTWGNITALATGPGNILYAAVARSFVATDDPLTQNTEGLFTNPATLGATPSMIISFADASGGFDGCSNGPGTGILPVGDGIADAAAAGLTLTPGVNNFRMFVLGDGPDVRGASGSSSPVLGTVSNTQKISFQVDYTIYSGLAADEEGAVYVVSGGTPAGVGRNPSPNLGEMLIFPDSAPEDRRADYIDLRGPKVPTPPRPPNVGDGVSDRFDHIFWQAPIDSTTLTPEGISGLARGFLLYLNRTRTADNTPTLPNGSPQGDDATNGVVNFGDLDPGQQVAGGDDQTFPFTGDDSDGGGSPALAGPLKGGFEFIFPNGAGGNSVWNGFYLNSNGSVSFGAGDIANIPSTSSFLAGAPRIAGAWSDLNPNSRGAGFLNTFPVQALGFAGVNHFKVRWINAPEFGFEVCKNSNTFSVSLFDDGTGLDENATQPLNAANPIGNNSVAFDLAEGPTALRWVLNTSTGVLVPQHPRAPGSGNSTITYGRMDLIGGPNGPVLVGFSAGSLSAGGPNQQVLNLSGQINPIGVSSQLAIYEFFNTGNDSRFPYVPSFDLRFEGNDSAMSTPATQPDLNGDVLQFASLIVPTSSNHLPYTDDPLIPGVTVIKAVHITELRTRIDALRARIQLAAFPYTDPNPVPGTTLVLARYTTELRTALSQVYTAEGLSPPSFTDPTLVPGTTTVKAVHIMELRNTVGALE